MKYEKQYFGQELRLMTENSKPMAAFCRAVREDVDEFGGQDFSSLVISNLVKRRVFYIDGPNGKLIYTVFVKPDEMWRFHLYKNLKKQSIWTWSDDKELIESLLLGYSF